MSVTMPRMIITTHEQDDALSELASRYESVEVRPVETGGRGRTGLRIGGTGPYVGAIVATCGKWHADRWGGYDFEPAARYEIAESGVMTGQWFDRPSAREREELARGR